MVIIPPDGSILTILPEHNGDYGQVVFELVDDGVHVHQAGLTVVFLRSLLPYVTAWEAGLFETFQGH